MKSILVGVDGSEESRAAASFAASLAEQTGARLILAGISTPGDPLGDTEWQARLREYVEEDWVRTTKAVKAVAAGIARPTLSIETVVEAGAPAATLAEMAARRGVDLVVVGHRGRGALKRALLGSVADRLVQISPKPVTVVR